MKGQSKTTNSRYAVLTAFISLLFAAPVQAQTQQVRIGEIEFFGTNGVNVEKVRAAIPIREGDEFSFEVLPDLLARVKNAIRESSGEEATDVESVCCDAHKSWIIYIGLRGQNFKVTRYRPAPTDSIRFPPDVVTLYRQTMDQIMESVYAQATEDRSQGYALSTYAPLRAKQLALREYATHNASLVFRVLNESADAEQRTVAAQLLGYANQNRRQVTALVIASRDRDEAVRNNAIRALGVLAESSPSTARQIPAQPFIAMLNSGTWRDRNKGAYLMTSLTIPREPRLLRLLRMEASDSLVEMARWSESGHAQNSRVILGRIAGLKEDRLQKLAVEDPDEIIRSFSKARR